MSMYKCMSIYIWVYMVELFCMSVLDVWVNMYVWVYMYVWVCMYEYIYMSMYVCVCM